jgi:APA family basic amino acid/polyamine antiporter
VVFPSVAPWQKEAAIALIVAMTTLHAIDTVIGGWVQTGFTAAKTVLIVVFIGAGLLVGHGDWGHLASQGGGTANIGTEAFAMALMYVSFAYSGWNAAAYIAGEIKQPATTLPRALLVGTGIVMVLYVALNLVFFYALPSSVLAGPPDGMPVIEVGATSATALFGGSAGNLLATLIALALISSVSAMVMAGPRVYAAMADDGALPRKLGYRSRRGVPVAAVVTQGVLASVVVLIGTLGEIIRYVGFTLAIFAALTVGAVFILRQTRPAAERPYRTLGYPVTPIAFIALSAWIAYAQIHQKPMESLWGAATIGSGLLVYVFGQLAARRDPPLPVARVRD